MHGLTTWWFAVPEPPDPRPLLAVDGRGTQDAARPGLERRDGQPGRSVVRPAGRHLVEATTLLARPDGPRARTRCSPTSPTSTTARPTDWEVVAHHVIPDAVPATPPPLRLTRPVDAGDGLFVCGDHRDTASIQGALVSGQRAARAVLAGLRRFGRFDRR